MFPVSFAEFCVKDFESKFKKSFGAEFILYLYLYFIFFFVNILYI